MRSGHIEPTPILIFAPFIAFDPVHQPELEPLYGAFVHGAAMRRLPFEVRLVREDVKLYSPTAMRKRFDNIERAFVFAVS